MHNFWGLDSIQIFYTARCFVCFVLKLILRHRSFTSQHEFVWCSGFDEKTLQRVELLEVPQLCFNFTKTHVSLLICLVNSSLQGVE